ncbi:MAG TPA: PASTA domain-containing protein [Moheibacter sp.]|nr:PASTA domain-containing protein [Moheibacter sp.]
MKLFKALTKWQLWASILLMGLVCFGLYHFIFKVWLSTYTNHNQEIEIPDLSAMNINQAMKTLDSLELTYEIDSVQFDSTKIPLAVLEFYPAKGFRVKEGRKIFIKSNPKGWRPTTLPDIVGKSKRLAFTQLKLSGLEVGDTIYEPDIAKDAVLRVMFQGKQISKDTELPRFTKVDLVLGKGLEYGVDMANLIGMTLEQGRSSVMANRFEIGRLNVEGAVTDSSLLRIFYQYPLPGDNYDQGLPVDLWVSEKDPRDLAERVKDLDRQYRNFDNDSIASAKYAEELKLQQKTIEKSGSNSPDIPDSPPGQKVEQPEGVEID